MSHLRLVPDDLPHPSAISTAHAVAVEPDVPGWTRVTVRKQGVGIVAHGTLRSEEVTDGFLAGLALYFLGDRSAVLHGVRREATG